MALNLFTSNRMEVLVDALGTTLREPPASAFTREGDCMLCLPSPKFSYRTELISIQATILISE